MFRMWFLAFVGQPRDRHAYEHAHESPPVMALPLVILAVLAVCVAWSYQYLGYFAIAAAFFVGRGWQQGWFQALAAAFHRTHHAGDEHGADHGHSHGSSHDAGELPAHGHEAAATHGATAPMSALAAGHGHAAEAGHDAASEPPITWGWLATMLVCTVVGGWIIQQGLGASWRDGLSLGALLEQARPAGTLADVRGTWVRWTWPNEHASHALAIRVPATLLATGSWLGGFVLAAAFFWWGLLRAEDVRQQFAPLYRLLVNKWWFDELYDALLVQPTLVVSRMVAGFDRQWIDGLLDGTARACVRLSQFWDRLADRLVVDGLVNVLADWTYAVGVSLHALQTGRIRQYVLFIVVGAIALFVLISFFWSPSLAG
jgi:NADH-quinone oxidoreductase subunit L